MFRFSFPSDGHDRAGKIPCRAMTKVKVRYGGMLLCGSEPPATERADGLIVTLLPEDGV
jgi:hypothetical protein